MHDLVLYAVPFFIVFLALEAISFKIAKAEDGIVGYERRDTATSLTMGLGSVVIGAVWALVVIVFYAALHDQPAADADRPGLALGAALLP